MNELLEAPTLSLLRPCYVGIIFLELVIKSQTKSAHFTGQAKGIRLRIEGKFLSGHFFFKASYLFHAAFVLHAIDVLSVTMLRYSTSRVTLTDAAGPTVCYL